MEAHARRQVDPPHSPPYLLDELRQVMRFSDADLGRLRELLPVVRPSLGRMAEVVFRSLSDTPLINRIVGEVGTQRLSAVLGEWAVEFFSSDRDRSYEELRSRIGARHLSQGLEQHHLMGAMSVFRTYIVGVASRAFGGSDRLPGLIETLHRAIDLETGLITEHYAVRRWEAEHRVSQSQEQYRSLFEAVADGAFVVDRQGCYTLCNHVFPAILGRRLDEVLGKHVTDFYPSPAAEIVTALHRQVMSTGRPLNAQINLDLPARNVWLSVNYSPIRGPSGEVVAITGIARDVTEERQRSAIQAHHHKMTSLGFLASGIAHEVANPLASIASMAGDLEETIVDLRAKSLLRSIGSCTQRAARSLRQMLSFARPNTREPELTSLNEAVLRTVELASFDPRARRFDLKSDIQPDLPWVMGNPDDLSQVLLNLILNAFDAMEGRTGTIVVRTWHEDDRVHVAVSDTGPGIAPELALRIFEPFYSTKTSTRGTGLGLFVSRQIVRDHHGSLTVESTPGVGSTFIIKLPVPARAPADPRSRPPGREL